MARFDYVLAQALKLDTIEQVKLISTLAHKVEEQIRLGEIRSAESARPIIDARPGTGH